MAKSRIEVNELSVQFKDKKVLDNVSLTIEPNKIYGVLGKNGTGKSTLLNTIVGGIIPKHGEVRINGVNPYAKAEVLEHVCIVREQEFLQTDIKVKDIFKLYQIFFPNYDKAFQDRLVKYFDLPVKKQYRTYSRGMKTLVSNIIGLCSNAEIIIFDEPTIGLDVVNRKQFYEILLEVYSREPRTMILSTHQIDEIEQLIEHVIMLDKGQIIIDEEVEKIQEKAYFLKGNKEVLAVQPKLNGKSPRQGFGHSVVYGCYDTFTEDELEVLKEQGIEREGMTLSELFVELTKGEAFNL